MKFKKVLFGIVIFQLYGCLDRIEVPLTTSEKQLIIFGQLTTLDEPQFVYLSESFGKTNQQTAINGALQRDELPTPVAGAHIVLRDDKNNSWSFRENKPGQYQLQGLAHGLPGNCYALEVNVGAKTYRSPFERVPDQIGSDSAFYAISEDVFPSKDLNRLTHLLNVFSRTELPNEPNYFLKWDVSEVYFWELTFFPNPFNVPPPDCFVFSRVDAQKINLFDGSRTNLKNITQQLATREIDATFKNRHYIIVRQYSISKEAHDYWSKVKSIINNTGSVFDTPPAQIMGNMQNIDNPQDRALGYFEVSSTIETRFFLVRGFIPHYLEPFCEYIPGKPRNEYDKTCLSCSAIPNGSGVRPPWF